MKTRKQKQIIIYNDDVCEYVDTYKNDIIESLKEYKTYIKVGDQGFIKSGCPLGKRGYTVIKVDGDNIELLSWDSMDKKTINIFDFEVIKESLEVSESDIFEEAHNLIDLDFEDLKCLIKHFDLSNYDKILVCADLGLWYGRRKAKAYFNNLYDALLRCFEDVNKIYFTSMKNTLTLEARHHDGCNIFKFYYIKNNKKYAINFNSFVC